jgi:predicted RNA-binding protein Jag
MDFAALRDSYVTLVAEAGANVKELQTLARHSTADLTLNVYAKKRDERLAELAERIGESVLFEQECAISVPRKPTETKVLDAKLLPSNDLETHTENGGGGIRKPRRGSDTLRTPHVQKCSRTAPEGNRWRF